MSAVTGTFPLGLLRSQSFGALWRAQVASRFGDPITLIALAYVSYLRTGSALVTALAVVMATVPYAVFGFFGGVIADAIGNKRAMIGCDLARVVFVALVPVSLGIGLPLAIAYALVFAAASCGAIFNPARLALVPRLVTAEELPAANSLTYSSDRAVEVLGALAAGLLVATIGERAFYVDALTFLVSAGLLTRIRVTEDRKPLSLASAAKEAREGVRFLANHAVLRANTIFSLICQLSIPVASSLAPTLIFQRFAKGDVQLGSSQFGASEAAIAIGAVASGLLLAPGLTKIPKGRLLLVGFAVYGVILVTLALTPSFEFALVLFFLTGVVNVLFYVPNVTISQEITPPELRARVFGARMALLNLSWLPVIVISGALADSVGVPLLIAAAGVLTFAGALIGVLVPIVRDVP
jgi:MFS family permease